MSFDKEELIFEKAKLKLSSSTAIKAFIDTYFPGGKLNLFNGSIPELQPEITNYPVVAFTSIDLSEKGDSVKENRFIGSVSIVIIDKTTFAGGKFFSETTIPGSATTPETIVRELPGKVKVQKFWKVVASEILSIKGLYAKIGTTGETLLEEEFPIFRFSGFFSFAFKREMRTGSRL